MYRIFLRVISVDEESNCAWRALKILTFCRKKLFHTQARIFVNLSCFCSIQVLPIRVFDCLLVSHLTKDCFCLPFTVIKTDTAKTIWSTNLKIIENMATISINYTGEDPEVKFHLYTKDGFIPLRYVKESINPLRLKTCYLLQLLLHISL